MNNKKKKKNTRFREWNVENSKKNLHIYDYRTRNLMIVKKKKYVFYS